MNLPNARLRLLTGTLMSMIFAGSWPLMWGLLPGTPAADAFTLEPQQRFYMGWQLDHAWNPMPGLATLQTSDLRRRTELDVMESSDYDFLGHCDQLVDLRIEANAAIAPSATPWGLEQLPALPHLSRLRANHSNLGSLETARRFPYLRRIEIRNTPITSLQGLESLQHLRHLEVGIRVLGGYRRDPVFNGAQRVLMSRDVPLDITALASMPSLITLDLGYRNVRELGPIVRHTNLTVLKLNQNHLTSIEGLQSLSHLESLRVDGNAIEDLTPLLSLPVLRDIWLAGNPPTAANATVVHTLRERGVRIVDLPKLPRNTP